MIEINELKLRITPVEARNIVRRHTDDFGVFFDLDRVSEHLFMFDMTHNQLLAKLRAFTGDSKIKFNSSEDLIKFASRYLSIPSYNLIDKGSRKPAFNKIVRKRIQDDPNMNQDQKAFAKLVDLGAYNGYMCGYLKQYLNLPLCNGTDSKGHRMVVGHPNWEMLATSRISASDPSIQNINEAVKDIITTPAGYKIMRVDSDQIEPRINYSFFIRDELIMNLIKMYNDAYFGIYHFVSMTDEEEIKARVDFSTVKKHTITPELKEQRSTIKTLTNAANYGSSDLGKVDPALAASYDKRIVNNPARIKFEQDVREQVARGADRFYGAFGSEVVPDTTQKYKDKNSNSWKEHLIRCGVNNPVQTTASELMSFSVYEADKILKGTRSSICYYKHDEACFYVHEDEYDMLEPQLNDITAYKVLDWIPITAGAEYGIYHSDRRHFV